MPEADQGRRPGDIIPEALLCADLRRTVRGPPVGAADPGVNGIAFARYKNTGAYCAVVAEVEAGREIRVRRLALAVDVGLVVNPDGLANQIEGGAVQAVSWTLKEAVRFDRTRVTSESWEAI